MLPDGCGCISAAGNGHEVQPADSKEVGQGKKWTPQKGTPMQGHPGLGKMINQLYPIANIPHFKVLSHRNLPLER